MLTRSSTEQHRRAGSAIFGLTNQENVEPEPEPEASGGKVAVPAPAPGPSPSTKMRSPLTEMKVSE